MSLDLRFTILLALLFCGSDLCSQVDPVQTASLPGIISESSGLQLDPEGFIWTFNDDDNGRIHAIQESGAYAGQLILDGASQIDYEDISIDNEGTVYIGDFGNNDNDRDNLRIYKIPNASEFLNGAASVQAIDFSLSDQEDFPPSDDDRNYDIEAMAYYSDSLHLFTRNRTSPYNGITKWYTLSTNPGNQTAILRGSYSGNLSQTFSSVTAADISPSGTRLVLLSRGAVVIFTNPMDDDFLSGADAYNFFTFSSALEGVTFLDDCTVLISEESQGNDDGRLFELNTCGIVSDLPEKQFPAPRLFIENDVLKWTSESTYQISSVEVQDIQGRTIIAAKNRPHLDFLTWKPGSYLIIFNSENQVFTTHFVK